MHNVAGKPGIWYKGAAGTTGSVEISSFEWSIYNLII